MVAYTKDAGIWKPVNSFWTKDAGVWKEPVQGYAKDAGIWKPFLTPPFSWEFLQAEFHPSSNPSGDIFTFAARNIGAAEDGRVLAIGLFSAIGGGQSRAFSTVTIGGQSVTLPYNTGSTQLPVAMGYVPLDSSYGTTADIVVTMVSGDIFRVGYGLWALYNPTANAPSAGGTTATSATSVRSVSPTIPADGVCFAVGGTGTGGDTAAWSGVATEDFEIDSSNLMTGAHAEASGTMTVTYNTSTTNAMAYGIWS